MDGIEKGETRLHSFFIFNVIPPKKEGALPIIYWYHSEEEQEEVFKINQVGLIMTFLGFCKKFKPNHPCDYISTDKHEIAINPLYGDIYMAVTIESKTSSNMYLLQSILKHCRSMFSHFWVPLPETIHEGEEPPSTELIVSQLDDAFHFIVNSIDWEHLDFSYMFNSYTTQQINGDMNQLKQLCAQLLLRHRNELVDIAILYRNHRVVHTTFSATVTRALAFGMRKKFGHLFLHNPRADRDALTWIIGLYTDMNGLISLYQPVIYISGVPHLLVAFKLKHFKIVLTLNPNAEISTEMLQGIPKYLKDLREFLKNIQATKPASDVPVPFAFASNSQQEQQLYFDCSQIELKYRQAVDINIIRGHQSVVNTGNIASVAFPGICGYFVTLVRNGPRKTERVITCKSPTQSVSDSLKICQRISATRDQTKKPEDNSICYI